MIYCYVSVLIICIFYSFKNSRGMGFINPIFIKKHIFNSFSVFISSKGFFAIRTKSELLPTLIFPVLLFIQLLGATVAEYSTCELVIPDYDSNSLWIEKPGTIVAALASVPAIIGTLLSTSAFVIIWIAST